MWCLRFLLLLGLFLLGAPPSCASLIAPSPPEEEDATPFLRAADSDTPASSPSFSSRFPPREYSFDPRPNIDPSDVIYNPGSLSTLVSDSSELYKDKERDTADTTDITDTTDQTTQLKKKDDDDEHSHQDDGDDYHGGKVGQNITVMSGEAGEGDLPPSADGQVDQPRAIVNVQSDPLSGEVSYIIHPDNLPLPVYTPLKDLSPTYPVAEWRPDIFMKVCCSEPDPTPQLDSTPDPTPQLDSTPDPAPLLDSTPDPTPEPDPTSQHDPTPAEVKSGHTHLVSTLLDALIEDDDGGTVELNTEEEEERGNTADTDYVPHKKGGETQDSKEEMATTVIPEIFNDTSSQKLSNDSTAETLLESNDTHPRPDIPSNHTPRYEESSSSAYQDVTNFLKDIANSEGFKNAFLGDLIKNFGNLDQNAMKLIYSLLIRPLEGAQSTSSKKDRVGVEAEDMTVLSDRAPVPAQHLMVLEKDRLPLRDLPGNGYQPFRSLFSHSRPRPPPRPPLRPSSLVRQVPPSVSSEESWRPSRTFAMLPSNGHRGDEGVDVITAPPFQNFEVVLGSSINHNRKQGGIGPQGFPIPPKTPGLPFDKLTLGLEMPPPDALEALPPGSVLIPPSQILGRPKLPQIHPNRNGAPNIEMPLKEFLPSLPFFNQPSRMRPPAQPQVQDVPARLPSILSSLLPGAPPPRPVRPPGPVVQPPRSPGPMNTSPQRPIFPDRRQPTGPPLPVTKLTPPGQRMPPIVPTVRAPTPVLHHESVSGSFVRPDAAPDPVFVTVSSPSLPGPDAAPSQDQVAPEMTGDHGTVTDTQPALTGEQEGSSGLETHIEEYLPENDEYHVENDIYAPGSPHDSQQPSGAVYYHDVQPEFSHDYYDVYYNEYYNGEMGGTGTGEHFSQTGEVDSTGEYHDGEDIADTHYSVSPSHDSNLDSVSTSSPLTSSLTPPLQDSQPNYSSEEEPYMEVHQSDLDDPYLASHQPTLDDPYLISHQPEDEQVYPEDEHPNLDDHYQENHHHDLDDPYLQGHHPDLYGILDMPPESVIPTLTEQEKNDLQMLLQNHRMATAMVEGNSTVVNLIPADGDASVAGDQQPPGVVEGGLVPSPANTDGDVPTGGGHDHLPGTGTGHHDSWEPAVAPSILAEDGVYSQHNTSISQLWNNVRLIPLAPELFNDTDNEVDVNLTSLFQDAVPLSPSAPQDSELEKITINAGDGHVTITEEVIVEDDKANAKFMAYVLIGACCGLALLSITGVIVILRFKKTCGSRQIKTRTRLTEQGSVENISRRAENLTLGGESGHKLGSWFTGRNEQFGSGKLRSNMALPAVHDLKRDKNGTSGSTRDLLSISSESSGSCSPNQPQRGGEASGQGEEEEPRASWLHDEYRASASDLSQAGAQDLAYIPHQYHQQARTSSNSNTNKSPHHQRYHPESSVEVEHLERSVRERRYTGQSRQEVRYGQQYIMSMDSEELEERMAHRDPRYATDSELDDGTTQYDDDESRDPSQYFGNSRELEDMISSRRGDPDTMTSQELGENLSRDLKQYQSRRVNRSHQQQQPQQQQQQQESRDMSQPPESSSQEVEGENSSRELHRSQSQVSFSRDNVQNEVFLEFDSMLRQHGQYLQSEPPTASTLGRASRGTDHTNLSVSRANTPDSIDLPEDYPHHSRRHDHNDSPPSPPNTPPRFSPPPPPPRPPKPGHLSEPGTPSPQAGRARPPSPGHSPPSPPRSNQRPVYWTSEEERLI